jgi:hypothetical protein
MLNKIVMLLAAGALVALLTPSEAGAYGAAHVGYTHVGPNGVYHTGSTEVSGPRGTYETGHTSAAGYGGGSYHSEYGAGRTEYGGAAYGGASYHYSPSYYGGASGGAVHYDYVR